MASRILNVALYQTGWFCCVLGAARGHPWLGAGAATILLLAHLALVTDRQREIRLVLAAALIGGAVDSLQSCLGLLHFRSGYVIGCIAPVWILLMWMQFATMLRFSLAFLAGRYVLAAVLGALGGPLAFWAGQRLGGVTFGIPAWRSLAVLAVVWAVVFPVLLRLAAGRDKTAVPGRYRWLS
jgi:hypothetical protein